MILSTVSTRRRAELLRDEEITNGIVIGDRSVYQYYTDRRCQCSHSNDTTVGYVLRLTVTNGEILRRGLPDSAGQYLIGYDVDAVDGADRYAEARRLAESHSPDVVVIDRLYACGCRIG